MPLTPGEALSALSAILAFPGIQGLPAPVQAVARWIALLERHRVKGGDVFDLQLVAVMQANDVRRVYTFTVADFEVFTELAVVNPGPGVY